MGGGGGAPSRNTGGGGAPTRNTGGGQQPGGGRQTGGGRQAGGNMPGSGSPFGQQNIGNKPSGNPMGGGGAPGGQMPSINMGGSPSPAGNNLGTIGGGPGMPSISFQNGFPMINIGNPPAGGGPGSKASTKPGTNAKPSKPSPSMNGLVSNTPGGSVSIWGFQNSFSNKGGNSCKDPSWCRMWGELCADPKYSRKIARECPATCGKCGGGGGRGGPSGGAGSTGGMLIFPQELKLKFGNHCPLNLLIMYNKQISTYGNLKNFVNMSPHILFIVRTCFWVLTQLCPTSCMSRRLIHYINSDGWYLFTC